MDNIGSAYLRIVPDTTGLNARLAAYFKGPKFSTMGKVAGGALAGALAAGGVVKVAADIGSEFDEAFNNIRVGTGATGKALEGLEGSFKKVIRGVPADFDEASTAVADLNTRLDLTGKPLVRLSKQFTELSRITKTDVGRNIQSVTRLFGDWSVKTRDQEQTLDKLFRTSQATGVEVGALSDLMVQFGSPLRQLGFSFDEAAVMFGRFEKEGVNIQTLMPGLRMALKTIAVPSDELSATFKRLNIDTSDSHEALLQLFSVFKDNSISEADQKLLASQVFGGRAFVDMKAAIEEGRFEFDDLIKQMNNGTDTIRGAGKDTMELGDTWKVISNNLKVFVEPAASAVFGAIKDGSESLRKAIPDIRRFFRELGRSDEFTELGEAFSALGRGIRNVVEDVIMPVVRAVAPGFLKMQEGVLKGFKGFINIIAGVLTLDFGRAWDGLKSIVGGFFDWIEGAVSAGAALVKAPVKAFAKVATGPIGAAFTKVKDVVVWAFDKILGAMSTALGVAADAGDSFSWLPGVGGELGDFANAAHGAQASIDEFREELRGDNPESSFRKGLKGVDDAIGDLGKSFDVSRKDFKKWQKDGGKSLGEVADDGDKFSKKFRGKLAEVGKGLQSLDGVFADGLGNMGSNLNSLLGGMKVAKIKYQIKQAGKQVGSLFDTKAAGGMVRMPGVGLQDTIPLGVNGAYNTLVAPGEDIGVFNRHQRPLADYAMQATYGVDGLDGFFDRFDRPHYMAKGGVLSKGFNVDGARPGFVPFMNFLNSMYGPLYVMSGLRPGSITTSGNVSNHASGRAVDISTHGIEGASSDASLNATGPLARRMDALHAYMARNIKLPGDFLWRTLTGGNHYNHIHRGITSAEADDPSKMIAYLGTLPGGAGFGNLRRQIILGPDGPGKTGGQAGLDLARKMGNAMLRKSLSTPQFGTGKIGDYETSGGSVRGWATWFTGGQMASGLNTDTDPGIALNPNPGGPDPGSWNNATTRKWLADRQNFLVELGGHRAILPVLDMGPAGWTGNAIDVNKAGVSKLGFSTSNFPSGTVGTASAVGRKARGGWLRYAKGKSPKTDGSFDVTQRPPFFDPSKSKLRLLEPWKTAERMQRQLEAVEQLDERIDIADRLASIDGEFTESERLQALGLNTDLLRKLIKVRDFSESGLEKAERRLRRKNTPRWERESLRELVTSFGDELREMQGVTGGGGRLLDTMLTLRELGTPVVTDSTINGMTVDQLLEAREAFQLGLLDNLPAFHEGGWAGTPPPGGREMHAKLSDGEYVLRPEVAAAAAAGARGGDAPRALYATFKVGDEVLVDKIRGEIYDHEYEAEQNMKVAGINW